MRRLLLVAATLAFSAGAAAQMYKWKDPNGRTQYGDTPPPGVDATPMHGPGRGAPAAAPEAQKSDGKQEKQLTPEEAFRKRQAERQAADEKEAKDRAQAQAKQQNCERAQSQLRMLESGMRMSTVNADGERAFMDDEQRAQETQRAQKAVSDWCN